MSEWIPISEELPNYDVNVLVCDSSTGRMAIWSKNSMGGETDCWEDCYGYYQNIDDVDAWMPLPEPYKEEKNDD